MNHAEDFFQNILEQIEGGQGVESAVHGLPEPEADLVRFASSLSAVRYPAENEAVVATQEIEVLAAAAQQFGAAGTQRPSSPTLWQQLQQWFQAGDRSGELALAAAAILLLLIFGATVLNRAPAEQPIIEQAETDTAVIIPSEADEPTGEGEVVVTEPDEPILLEPTSEVLTDISTLTVLDAPHPPGENQLYLPAVGSELILTAQTAVLNGVEGLVEVESGGVWTAVTQSAILSAGQRVRTGQFAQATLTFFDGSTAQIGAESDLSIDQLNALRPAQGFRTVVMTQWTGESEHTVAFRNDGGSRYEVKSPTGTGIARGTIFQVLVNPGGITRYIVTEGKVDVTNASQTVSVVGGQTTRFLAEEPPEPASFLVIGSGQVESIGESWKVAGQTFQTHSGTIIVGNPQVGDLVQVEGYQLADGGQMADRIVLMRRSLNNEFTISGEVSQMGASWIISGQEVAVDEETTIAASIDLGDTVTVEGYVALDGTLVATRIFEPMAELGEPFTFGGVVQQMGTNRWLVSGQLIYLAEETTLRGNVSVGDVVEVTGWILSDGRWVAGTISRQNAPQLTFTFSGLVEQMEPWIVGGIDFEVALWSIIPPSVGVGDFVTVRGVVMPDGTRVASSISLLPDNGRQFITFNGILTSIDPWIVNGILLEPGSQTRFGDNLMVGMQVQVRIFLLPNGRWQIRSIRALYPQFGLGCFTINTRLINIGNGGIEVLNWPGQIVENGQISIIDDIKIDDVVQIPVCTRFNGTIIIVGEIIVVYRPIVIIINPGNPGNGNPLPPGCRITKKGSIKCTGRSSRKS